MGWFKRFGLIQTQDIPSWAQKEDECVINLIQAIEGWFGLIGLDLWHGLMGDWFSCSISVNRYFSYSRVSNFGPDLP